MSRRPRVVDWQLAVRDHPDLSPRARLLGLVMATYMRGDSLDCWPPLELLAENLGLKPQPKTGERDHKTVLRARSELIEAALLVIVKGGGRGRATSYRGLLETVAPRHPFSPRNSGKSGSKRWQEYPTNISYGDEHAAGCAAPSGAHPLQRETNGARACSSGCNDGYVWRNEAGDCFPYANRPVGSVLARCPTCHTSSNGRGVTDATHSIADAFGTFTESPNGAHA
jgi:hypothetical protein